MISLFLLAVRTDFFGDIALPAIVGAVVLLWIGNSILNKLGWTLW